mmetsp:Transcript_23487/g.50921  ORF Transcript_23487/g.50921 Transcript_23487/m.50921 type:complete len:96 (-) Transcript_23487:434-721(-)
MARIILDWARVGHLCLLVALTLLIGRLLSDRFGFGKLTAYGLSCSFVCQISNAIMKIYVDEELNEDDQGSKSESKSERRKAGGNPKKRKQRQKSA